MLAFEYQSDGGLQVVRRRMPVAEPGDVIVRMSASGICGTDLKIARGEHRLYPPGTVRIPGHEITGVVHHNASGRTDLAEGTAVAIAPNIACGHCPACAAGRGNLCGNYRAVGLTMNGGFADFIRIPSDAVAAGNVLTLPAGLDVVSAALVEPVAAVVRGLAPLALSPGDTVLVCGAGPIGLIAVILARMAGVQRIIVSQTSPRRRELARDFGADLTIDPRAGGLAEQVLTATGGWGADAIIAAAPVPSLFTDSVRAAAKGGRINFFAGLPTGKGEVGLDANLIHYRELLVTGTTANTNADCRQALELLAADPGRFTPLITDRYPLQLAEDAFTRAASGQGLKVLLQPPQ